MQLFIDIFINFEDENIFLDEKLTKKILKVENTPQFLLFCIDFLKEKIISSENLLFLFRILCYNYKGLTLQQIF